MGVTTTNNKPFNPRGNDQSPLAYNKAAIYSGKALDFDGVNDNVEVADNASLDFTTAMSAFCYARVDSTSLTGDYIFAKYDYGTNNRSWFILQDNKNFKIVISKNGTSGASDTKEYYAEAFQSNSEYYFIGFTFESNVLKLYLNGQEITATKANDAEVNAIYSGSAKLSIGSSQLNGSGANFFDGKVANPRAFNTALTAAQIADLYNFPEKIVPTGVDNTALKLWLPMMEGAGTTAINGAPDALGSELVINGTFDSAANWVHSAQYSISSGKASYDGTGSGKLYQTGKNLVATKKYILTFDVSNASTYAHMWIGNEPGSNSYTASNTYQTYYNGTNAVLFEGANIGTETTLAFWGSTVGSSFSIDNISLKEVANYGTISGATWQHGIGTPVAQTAVINWNKLKLEGGSTTNEYLVPQGLTSGRDLLGNLFTNVRKQGALNLDGNSYAEVHDNASLDMTQAISAECWVYWRQTTASNDSGLLSRWDGATGRQFLIYHNTTTILQFYINNANSSYSSMTEGWHHIIGTYDKVNRKIYVDGVLRVADAQTISIPPSDDKIEIGRYSHIASKSTDDTVAQPRIYNRALTAEEVQRNYDAGKNIYS